MYFSYCSGLRKVFYWRKTFCHQHTELPFQDLYELKLYLLIPSSLATVRCKASEQSEAAKTKMFSHIAPLAKVKVSKTELMEFSEVIKKKKNWNNDISELETYFASTTLPIAPIKLNEWTSVINTKRFVDSHLAIIKNYNGHRVFIPYLNRLKELQTIFAAKNESAGL